METSPLLWTPSPMRRSYEHHLGLAKRPGSVAVWLSDAITAFANVPTVVAATAIIALTALAWVGISLSGGTQHATAHWFYLPIVMAAIRFGFKGGVGAALACAWVSGLLPLDAAQGIQQTLGGEIYRALFFVSAGVLMAAVGLRLDDSISKETMLSEHEAEVSEHEAELAAHAAVLAVSEGPFAAEQGIREVRLREVVFGVREGLEHPMRERVKIDVTDVVVRTNPAILQGLLRQLVDNALKFSPQRSTVEIDAWDSQTNHLYIGVSDRGSEIDEGFLPRAFEAFTQQDQSSTRSVGGVGIGLFIARRLATCLRAEVELRPRAGGGTEAVVVMPGSAVSTFLSPLSMHTKNARSNQLTREPHDSAGPSGPAKHPRKRRTLPLPRHGF